MAFKAAWMIIALGLPVATLPWATAWSQSSSSSQTRRAIQSSGLKASIGQISLQNSSHELVAQVILQNTTSERKYLFMVGSYSASLSDGLELTLRTATGIPYCNTKIDERVNTEFCIQQDGKDLNKYSYIEPNENMDISLRYSFRSANNNYQPSGTISFSLKLISRTAHAAPESLEAQADPGSITPPRLVVLNFPLTPLNFAGD